MIIPAATIKYNLCVIKNCKLLAIVVGAKDVFYKLCCNILTMYRYVVITCNETVFNYITQHIY